MGLIPTPVIVQPPAPVGSPATWKGCPTTNSTTISPSLPGKRDPGLWKGNRRGSSQRGGLANVPHRATLSKGPVIWLKENVGKKTENNFPFQVSTREAQMLWTEFLPLTARRSINLWTGLKHIHSLLARKFIFYPTDTRITQRYSWMPISGICNSKKLGIP